MNEHPDPAVILNSLASLLGARHVEATATTATVDFTVTEDWLQGRTAYGGLTAALGVQAMRDLALPLPDGSSLRALQTSFAGPLGVGLVHAEAVLLRDGKNVRQVQATLRQNGEVASVMFGVFAIDRQSTMRPVRLHRPVASKTPDESPARPASDELPRFLSHFEMRWDDGPPPGSGGSSMSTRIHLRLVDGDGLSDEMLTVMMADTSPTPATGQFTRRVPASSVSWALELRPLTAPVDRAGWWRADNQSLIVDGGYVNHAAKIWAPSGELAALAYQLVAVYG